MLQIKTILLLPPALLALISHVLAIQQLPTAIRKISPDSNDKILAEHLAFAPLNFLSGAAAAHEFLAAQDAESLQINGKSRLYRPAFARHHAESESTILERAAAALAILERRSSCPSGMTGCDAIGAPNKCCQDGTVCTNVNDSTVGNVACCPRGSNCGGNVGKCPSDAVSCPAELGGGCCIPGYVCQGEGCKFNKC